MSYADIHCHLLPGVDDGARSLDEALGYARRLVSEGVGEAVATPHIGHPVFGADPEELPERAAALVEALDEEGIPLRLHIGGELFPHGNAELPDEVLELISHGPDGARWLLMEVPFAGIDEQFVQDACALMGRGYGLVIAHPERASGLLEGGWELLAPLVAAGALLQVNVCSLLGNNGNQARVTGEALVRGGHAFALASDAHPGTREHTLALGFPLAVRAGASSTQAWRLTQANPRFLLESGIPQGPAALPFGPPVVAS